MSEKQLRQALGVTILFWFLVILIAVTLLACALSAKQALLY